MQRDVNTTIEEEVFSMWFPYIHCSVKDVFSMDPPGAYISRPNVNQKSVVEREWGESSPVKENRFGWRLFVSSGNWFWLRVIVKEGVNKSNHPIQNPLLLVTNTRDNNYQSRPTTLKLYLQPKYHQIKTHRNVRKLQIITSAGPSRWSIAHVDSIGFEALTAALMNSYIFFDIAPCRPLKFTRRFEWTYLFHLQGRRINKGGNHYEVRRKICLAYFFTMKMNAACSPKRRVIFNGLRAL
jgi:hypothetical protein